MMKKKNLTKILNYIKEESTKFNKAITGGEIVSNFEDKWNLSVHTVVEMLLKEAKKNNNLQVERVIKKSPGSQYQVYAFRWQIKRGD